MAVPAFIAEVASVGEWEDRAWFPPGPKLAVCLSGDKSGLNDLSDADLVEMAAAARRQTSWAQAQELAAIAELARRRDAEERNGDPDYRVLSAYESVVEEVSTALTVTGNAASTLVHLAGRLTTDLVGTREALEAGRIDLAKARVICDISDGLPEGVAERLEMALLDQAPSQTTGQLRRRAKRIVRRLAPNEVEDRKQARVEQRRLELWENPCGTADMALMDLAPEEAHGIYNKITAVAHALKADGDDRPLNLIRADLAKELLRGVPLPEAVALLLAEAQVPAEGSPDATAEATVSVAEDDSGHAGERPAAGLEAEEASDDGEDLALARALATVVDQRLTALSDQARAAGRLDGLAPLITGAVQDLYGSLAQLRDTGCRATEAEGHGHPGYRPPAAMRRLIEERHPTCVFPTCNRRSDRCDLDHTVPYCQGVTCQCNLAPLCRRHHRTKQTPGWKLLQIWPGLLVWITPSGTWRITLPDRQ